MLVNTQSVYLRNGTVLIPTHYQDAGRLASRLNKYIDQVAEFDGAKLAGDVVQSSDITGRELSLAIPKGGVTSVQQATIRSATDYAANRSVRLIVTPF